MNPDLQGEAISQLAGFDITETTLDETMRRLVEVARDAVDPADIAGLTIADRQGDLTTPFYTDEAALHIDTVQYAADRGPCVDAWRQHRTVRVDQLEDTTKPYPEFAAAARGAGIGSALGVPLLVSGRAIGALNLYSRDVEAFDESDETEALRLAEPIAVTISNAEAYWSAHELTQQLETAMRSRAVIEKAKGVLMANTGCDADGAFELLREQSQHENRKLREIAQEIVERQTRRT